MILVEEQLTLNQRVEGSFFRFAPNDLLRCSSPSEDTQSASRRSFFVPKPRPESQI